MKKIPKVSIVIPVYNGSKYMREAIDSALAQTYSNFEVIVVNDGSADGGKTERVAKSYGRKIRYFSKPNGGVSSALNFGIRKMKSEWLSWLSHDDVYLPDKLEKQIQFAKKHPEAKFIFSAYENIDEQGKSLPQSGKDWVPGSEPQFRQMLYGNKFSGGATLIHKSCFDKVGYFNEENIYAQDYEMWLLIALHFKMCRCPDVVLKRRVHLGMGSISARRKHRQDIEKTMKRIDSIISVKDVFPDQLNPHSSQKDLALAHMRLAKIYMHNWHSQLANKHYKIASDHWPSFNNPARIARLLGANLYNIRRTLLRFYWEALVILRTITQRIYSFLNKLSS